MDIYTIQTISGQEQIIAGYLDKLLTQGEISDHYIPMRETRRKVNGRWETHTERLFPGYLFIETEDLEQLFFRLKLIPRLSQLLGDRQGIFYRLTPEEVGYIRRIGADRGDHIFGVSQVMIDEENAGLQPGDRVRVISGDLLNFQGDIVRYDLHHRKAYLRTELFGGAEISVGIELIQKV